MSDDKSDNSDDSGKSYSDDDYTESGSGSEDDYNSDADEKGQLTTDYDEEDLKENEKKSGRRKIPAAVAVGADDTSTSTSKEAGVKNPLLTEKPSQPVVTVQPLAKQPPAKVREELPTTEENNLCVRLRLRWLTGMARTAKSPKSQEVCLFG